MTKERTLVLIDTALSTIGDVEDKTTDLSQSGCGTVAQISSSNLHDIKQALWSARWKIVEGVDENTADVTKEKLELSDGDVGGIVMLAHRSLFCLSDGSSEETRKESRAAFKRIADAIRSAEKTSSVNSEEKS